MGIFRKNVKMDSNISNIDPFEGFDDPLFDRNGGAGLFQRPKAKDVTTFDFVAPKAKPTARDTAAVNEKMSAATRVTMRAGWRIQRYAIVCLFLVMTGFALTKFDIMSMFSVNKIVYAYFEVRALDSHGRPIAGAIIKNAGKRVGTTDSFGEWRRFMRVPLGSTIPITLAKKNGTELLFATKNFAVPMEKPQNSEIELRGSVQLLSADQGNAMASQAAQSAPGDIVHAENKAAIGAQVSPQDVLAPKSSLPSNAKIAQASDAVADVVQARASVEAKAEETSASGVESSSNIGEINNFKSNHTSIWIEGLGPINSPLMREVVPALAQRAKEVGMILDPAAPWKVRLSNLIDRPSKVDKEGGGLIMVSSVDGENGGMAREFLRNYQADSRVTARGILYILTHHVNKNVVAVKRGARWAAVLPSNTPDLWRLSPNMALMGAGQQGASGQNFVLGGEEISEAKVHGFYLRSSASSPCPKDQNQCELKTRSYAEVAPVPTWTRLKIKLLTPNKDTLKLFISGYEAKLVGDKVYEYWGQDRARANVTVVQNNKVTQRTQIVGDSRGYVQLGLSAISKR